MPSVGKRAMRPNRTRRSGLLRFLTIALTIGSLVTATGCAIFQANADHASTEAVENLSESAGDARRPAVAASADRLHVAWIDNTPCGGGRILAYDVMYRPIAIDGPPLNSSPHNLSQRCDNHAAPPAIATSGEAVHVAWLADRQIHYRYSVDGGATFDAPKSLGSEASGPPATPAVAAFGDRVIVVWSRVARDHPNRQLQLVYRASGNRGATFQPLQTITRAPFPFAVFGPVVAATGRTVHVAWGQLSDPSSPRFELRYARSTDGGSDFEPIQTLDAAPTSDPIDVSDRAPDIAAIGSYVHVLWPNRSGPSEDARLMYRRSTDDGASFSAARSLIDPFRTRDPAIAADGNDVIALWPAAYRLSSDGGASYGPVQQFDLPLAHPSQLSSPTLTLRNGRLAVVWEDGGDILLARLDLRREN